MTDTERIDALQRAGQTVWRVCHHEPRQTTDTTATPEWVEVFDGWAVLPGSAPRPTIREAIDDYIKTP